jgi:glycine/D-amino acid oxidase-like deaminating enzyme
MTAYDVAIVGNGAIGLALALRLARRNASVLVIGNPQRPWSASAAAGAMLGCFGEVTAIGMRSAQGRARVEMAYRARPYWRAWLEQLSDDGLSLQTANGTIVMLNSVGVADLDDLSFKAIVDALRHYNEPYEEIDPRELTWLESTPASRALRALHIPAEHAVDATRLLQRTEAAVERAGGILHPGMAQSLDAQGGKVQGLSLAAGERIAAGAVVLAAGAATQTLLDGLPDIAAPIPRLLSGFGTSLVLKGVSDGPAHVVRTPNRSFGCGLHVVPRGGRNIYIGASNVIQPDLGAAPVVQDVASLMGAASKQLRRDLWFSEIARIQTGNRPISLDGFPLIGKAGIDGLWLATATNRDGLHLSPYIAEQVATAIGGGGLDPILNQFQPHRRPIEPLPRDEAIRSAAMQTVALGHEGGWNVPLELTRLLDRQLEAVFRSLADRISEEFVPPPEILSAARNFGSIVRLLQDWYGTVSSLTPARPATVP